MSDKPSRVRLALRHKGVMRRMGIDSIGDTGCAVRAHVVLDVYLLPHGELRKGGFLAINRDGDQRRNRQDEQGVFGPLGNATGAITRRAPEWRVRKKGNDG